MKSKIIVILAILITLCLPLLAFADSSEIRVFVDGKQIAFDQQPVMENGRVFVPIRYVAEAMDWEVSIDDDGVIRIQKAFLDGNKKYHTFIDLENGELSNIISIAQIIQREDVRQMEPMPKIINGRTVVGVRELAEGLYAEVDWDGSKRTVNITTKPLPYQDSPADILPVETPLATQEPNSIPSEKTETEKETEYRKQQEEWELEVIQLVNEERIREGLSEVTINTDLMAVARFRAEEMYEHKVGGHLSPTYNLEHTALAQYLGVNCQYAGENSYALHDGIIAGQSIMIRWMASDTHKAHILNPKVKEIGVGYWKGCWSLFLMY